MCYDTAVVFLLIFLSYLFCQGSARRYSAYSRSEYKLWTSCHNIKTTKYWIVQCYSTRTSGGHNSAKAQAWFSTFCPNFVAIDQLFSCYIYDIWIEHFPLCPITTFSLGRRVWHLLTYTPVFYSLLLCHTPKAIRAQLQHVSWSLEFKHGKEWRPHLGMTSYPVSLLLPQLMRLVSGGRQGCLSS